MSRHVDFMFLLTSVAVIWSVTFRSQRLNFEKQAEQLPEPAFSGALRWCLMPLRGILKRYDIIFFLAETRLTLLSIRLTRCEIIRRSVVAAVVSSKKHFFKC